MTGDPAVAVQDLAVTFGDHTAVSGASFDVARGSVACLVGPNGSGKTTVLRAVAGLVDPDAGRVDRSVEGPRPVGYLAQSPGFRPAFTARETIRFYADLVGTDPDVDAVLDRVGLAGVADRRVDALSGGMRRLLGIAHATVGDPDLLVLDEPSSGLDPMLARHVSSLVADLGASGTAVLVATHDLGMVEAVADDVVVLDRGRVAASGSPADLRARTDADDLEAALAALVAHEPGEIATRPAAGGGEP